MTSMTVSIHLAVKKKYLQLSSFSDLDIDFELIRQKEVHRETEMTRKTLQFLLFVGNRPQVENGQSNEAKNKVYVCEGFLIRGTTC